MDDNYSILLCMICLHPAHSEDIAMQEVEIPWNLRGFFLLNLCTALCAVAWSWIL